MDNKNNSNAMSIGKNMKTKNLLTGSAHKTARGLKPIQIWVTPIQLESLKKAAKLENRPLTQFVLHNALMSMSKVILQNILK
jgi:hypothetical protein